MLTDQDIEKLKGIFLTKEDGEKFATKDDLAAFERRAFATFATKADLEKFVRILGSRRLPISAGGGMADGAGRWGCGASGAGARSTSRTA